jgi:hypothetical protein
MLCEIKKHMKDSNSNVKICSQQQEGKSFFLRTYENMSHEQLLQSMYLQSRQ